MKNHTLTAVSIFTITCLAACGGGGGGSSGVASNPVTVTAAAPPPSGSVVISWNAPTTNIDGSPATVAGYNLYRLTPGTTPCVTDIDLYTIIPPVPASNLATVVGTPPPTTYTDSPLDSGNYCYGVTALNTLAQESVAVFLLNPIAVN